MPSRSRRALLGTVGTALVGLIAGCRGAPDGDATDTSADPTSVTESDTPTATDPDPPTETPTAASGALDCGPVLRPESAWPQPDRSAGGDGYAAGGPVFEAAPSVEWSVTPTAPEDLASYDPVFRQPVIADGTVYVVKFLQYGPSQERPEHHALQAHDAETGEVRWTLEFQQVPTDPVVDGDRLLVGTGTTVRAVARADGTERWTREFASRVQAVVPGPDMLYIALDERVSALGLDGATQWSVDLSETVTTRPALGSGAAYVGTLDGSVHAIRFDGERAWTETTLREGYENDDAPSVDRVVTTDCGVFAVTDGDIYAFAADGSFVWHAGEGYWGVSTDGDTLYGGTGDGHLRGIDAATGETDWERFYGRDDSRYVDGFYQSPVVTDGAVYAFGRYETLVALDSTDGTERWTVNDRINDLAVADGRLYGSRRDDGDLVALGHGS